MEDINQLELAAYILIISNEITLYKDKTIFNYLDLLEDEMIKTKKNEDMAFFSASDEVSKGNFTVFPKNIDVIKDLYEHDLVEVTGLVSKRFDKVSVIVNNISKVV